MRTRLQARGRWGWPVAALEGHSIGRVRPQRDGFRALAHQQDGVVRLLGLFDSRSRERLYDYFVKSGERETFELPPPESDDALESYVRAISLCAEYLGTDFTNIPGRHFSLALLFIDWMRGRPLSLLVSKRLGWLRRNNREIRLPQEIRQVLTDVEQYARFEGPLYLACYADVLNAAFPGAQDAPAPPDIAMLMELGVSRTTEVSMMGLGLSRTTVVSLAEHVVPDDLDVEACLVWLREHDFDALGFPALISAEIKAALTRAELRQT